MTDSKKNLLNNGNYYLHGNYVKMSEIESPGVKEPSEPSGNFIYSCKDRRFLSVMVYFHIDNFQNYLQSDLDLFNVCNLPIEVDPQGLAKNGTAVDNSHYVDPSDPDNPIARPYLAFGEGGVRDAEDAQVILHEYGHAIQDNCNPGFNNPRSGVGEGFGDILAAIYFDDRHKDKKTRGLMFSWDAAPFAGPVRPWEGRRYDNNLVFDGPEYR
jgi:Fungalysin metallopeptidase (M36)